MALQAISLELVATSIRVHELEGWLVGGEHRQMFAAARLTSNHLGRSKEATRRAPRERPPVGPT
jgi:hypothetical protein